MHLGLGEVWQATGVIGVKVGGDDLANVAGREAKAFDLPQGRLADLGSRAHDREERPELARIARVLGAEAGIEQDQAVVRLDQQAVADDPARLEEAAFAVNQPRAMGAQRPAVEVMDAHAAEQSMRVQRFGPTWRSMTAMASWRATEMFQGPSCRHAIPSRSQASQKICWMSSERLVKR